MKPCTLSICLLTFFASAQALSDTVELTLTPGPALPVEGPLVGAGVAADAGKAIVALTGELFEKLGEDQLESYGDANGSEGMVADGRLSAFHGVLERSQVVTILNAKTHETCMKLFLNFVPVGNDYFRIEPTKLLLEKSKVDQHKNGIGIVVEVTVMFPDPNPTGVSSYYYRFTVSDVKESPNEIPLNPATPSAYFPVPEGNVPLTVSVQVTEYNPGNKLLRMIGKFLKSAAS